MAQIMKEVVGFHGNVIFDETKPEGTIRKLSDVSRLSKMGWDYTINLREGLEKMMIKNQLKYIGLIEV